MVIFGLKGEFNMDFFSRLGETLTEAGKDVSQKAKDLTGIAKLNMDIKAKEDYMNKQYAAIGKKYYDLHKEDEEPLFEEMALITEAAEEIQRMERELADLKGMKKCPSCDASMEQDAMFCPKCGAKYESVYEEE